MRATLLIFLAIAAQCLGKNRIIGGHVAEDGAYPYQASLRSSFNKIHFCGGTIISASTILTSAQCLAVREPSAIFVAVGTNSADSGDDQYAVKHFIVHESYNPRTQDNNLALVITSTPIVFGPKVQAISTEYNHIAADTTVTLTGWGSTTKPNATHSDSLLVISLQTITVDDCRARLYGVKTNYGAVYDSSLCTLTMAAEGACTRDTGSPLVAGGKLVGIMSWSHMCADGYPDVYARISSYTSWIDYFKE